MEPAIQIYIGAPVSIGSEAKALRCLHDDLSRAGISARLLVNFQVEERQIDCVVITDEQATLLDFKNLNGPIKGGINGPWMLRDYGGAERAYDGENPYQEVLAAKYALAKALQKFHRRKAVGIAPEKGQFARLLDAAVCVVPSIAQGSSVTKGDFKCRVWSYAEAFSAITTRKLNSHWSMAEWTQFSNELGLEQVSLLAAISPEYRQAEKALSIYSKALREGFSAEIFPSLPGPFTSLPPDQHALMIGPSGIGKTVHLKRHATLLADGSHLVLFCSGRHYTDSLDRLLARSIAPFSKRTAAQLIEAAGKCGWDVHLMIDGIDGLATDREHDLSNGLAAFALRYNARIIVSSMKEIELPPTIKGATLTMPALTDEQKLAIFHFHSDAGCEPPHGFLAAFETAQDIMVAAKSALSIAVGYSRADYYAAYILESLPQESKIVAGKLLRQLANHLHQNLIRSIEFSEFERESTNFLSAVGGTLKIADSITKLPQVSTSRGLFSFKHDLWQDYLAAEWLVSSSASSAALCSELSKPINRRLVPHAIGRIRDLKVIAGIFEQVGDGELIVDGLAGGLGAPTKAYLERRRRQIWDDLIIDVADFQISVPLLDETLEGKRVTGWPQITGKRAGSNFELNVAGWISERLHQLETADQFIWLLESSSWALWNASETAARRDRLSTRAVFSGALHVLFYQSGPNIPLTVFGMFRSWEQSRWRRSSEGDPNFALREKLQDRLSSCRSEAKGPLLFCLATILRHDSCPDLELMSRVFHMGWDQGLRPVRNEVLELIERHGGDFAQVKPELVDAIKSKLEAVLGDDPISNTFIFDALNVLGAVSLPVSREGALAELRSVLDPQRIEEIFNLFGLNALQFSNPDSIRDMLSSYACGLVSKFWEDIFRGVYWEAYQALSQPEKVCFLNLAAMGNGESMAEPFVLRKLVEFNDLSSLDAFRFHAERVRIDQPSSQDAVAVWCLGIIGCARLGESLPLWRGGTDVGSKAWQLIGGILYKEHIDEGASEEANEIWLTLRSEAIEGAADVFLYLHSAEWTIQTDIRDQDLGCWRRLLDRQDHVRYIMEHSLLHLDQLVSSSTWNRSKERASFIVRVLGDLGNQSSVNVLRQFINHPDLGSDAVVAIERINRA